MSEQASEFGILGLTATARALALRLASRGWRVSLWDASFNALQQFLVEHMGTRGGQAGFESIDDFFDSLALPPRAACFLPADSEPARRAAVWAGAGLISACNPSDGTAEPLAGSVDEAVLAELEARLLVPME